MILIRRFAIALAAILILAIAGWFRIRGTLAEPLWLDEAYSAYAAAKGFDFLWNIVPLYETHPPFYYSLLRLWTLGFGDSLAALRALGIACGLLTVPVTVLAAREAARLVRLPAMPVMLAAGLVAALSPALVEMAREVRPYPVLILVYAAALLALIRAARGVEAAGRIPRRPFAAYCACLLLVLWLHNLGPLYAAALGLASLLLIARPGLSRRDWALLIGGQALAGLLYLPGLLILIDQAPTWVKSTWLHFSTVNLVPRLAEIYVAQGTKGIVGGCLLLLGAIVLLALRRGGWRLAAALLVAALLPVAASIALSLLVAPVFIVRTMTAAAVPSLILIAIGMGGVFGLPGWPRRIAMVAAGVCLILLAGRMAVIDVRRRASPPMQDWYAAVRWLEQRYRPGDMVWAYPNEGALPFDYAVRDLGLRIATRPIPTPIPTLDGGPGAWNPTGSRGVFSLPADRLAAIADAPDARAVPTIWLLRLGANAYDKGDHLLDALDRTRVRVGDCESYPIDIIGLARPDVAGPPQIFPEDRVPCEPDDKPPVRHKMKSPPPRDGDGDRFSTKKKRAALSGRRGGPAGAGAAR
ncbi:hypothetical protein [Edaphosphingomonas haloaromaticamans]|uniref:Glycosyltransferase RgtA/B/C/D-like domain-containing protein n=1 Tax=Edaphosphingomonas haloaromaticamans TaxID=653954 RepID=A0A1S1HLX5_9SPHN|nr:hypothetical protein [Sphingomonas haloaromaticamans]OHT22233.1 hypothetical protein BHE75_04258 [Sphingomonas haloaromaticamans]